MSNKPSNERGGQRPAPRSPSSMSLGQIGRDDTPLLIPITPNSTVDEIARMVQEAGAPRVELLVPDGTTALQSIAGNETLREAAKAAGVRVSLFTSDEKTTHAARFAKLDVVSVGGTVASPGPGDLARRPTGARPAVKPPTALVPPTPAQPASRPNRMPPTPAPTTPRRSPAQPATPAPVPANDDNFLSALDQFDQADAEPPRVQQSEQGALMFDVAGDVGVPRPAQNDDEWEAALGDLDSTIGQDAPPPPPRQTPSQRQRTVAEPRERLPRPSIFGALLGNFPARARRQREVPQEDEGPRMARPERTAEESAARRRQSRNLMLQALALIALLLVAGALVLYALNGTIDPRAAFNAAFNTAPTLQIAAPVNRAEAEEFSGQVVPLVREPVTNPASINVQGALLTAPVMVTLQGTAAGSTVAPIGFARGTITLRNRSSQAVSIPVGTEIDVNGLRFVVEDTVTVPPAVATDVGITFGVGEATLVARNPGAEGNIPAGTITTIPGYSGTLVVSQPAPFAGGNNQPVQIVSPADVEQLLPQALSRLYGQGVQSLQAQVQQLPGFALVQSASTPEITPTEELLKDVQPGDYSVFPPIGQVTEDGRFTLQVSETFAALASPLDQPIDQQLQRAVANQIKLQRPDLADAEVQITSWQRAEQGIMVDALVVPQSQTLEVPPELADEIGTQIAGKSRAEAQAYLDQLQANGAIGDFQLPAEWDPVPTDVKVQFNVPEPSAQ